MKKAIALFFFLFLAISSYAKVCPHQFLAVSDIHFNPFYACKKYDGPCPLAKELLEKPYTDWGAILKSASTNKLKVGFQDANYTLFSSLLGYLKKKNFKPKFIVLPGDFLAHSFVNKYKLYTADHDLKDYHQFVNKTFAYIATSLKQVFPYAPIYPVLGNNDSYGGDYFNAKPGGEFYHSLAEPDRWLQFMINPENRAAFIRQFPVNGYYKVHLFEHHSLIVLNTTLFSSKAKGSDVNQSAKDELKWLSRQFKAAEEKGYKVWLIYHIPFGVNVFDTVSKKHNVMFWNHEYQKEFFYLLDKYHQVVKAIISSHLHMDGFRLYQTKNGDTNSAIIDTYVPAVSPVYGNNPAFKIYDYNPKTFELTNFQTYYLNTRLMTPRWGLAYDFDKVYQPLCIKLSCLLKSGMLRITKINSLLSKYYRYFYAVGRNTQPITHGYWHSYRCAMLNQRDFRYKLCLLKS